jgi:uncharacterized delta-60 repeat protein
VALVAYVTSAGGASNDSARAVAPLPDEGCIVVGHYGGTATFGQGEPNQTVLGSAGSVDIFVARYNPDGTLLWAKRAGSPATDTAFDVTAFADGSCIVTGWYTGTCVFGPGEPGVTTLNDVDGLGEIFVARYHANGSLDWAVKAGRNFDDIGESVAGFPDGSCIVTGYFDTIAIFGEGEPNQTILNSAGTSPDVFIARYNADGTLAWVKQAGGVEQDVGSGVAVFADGTFVVTGYFGGAATFAPGEPEVTVLIAAGILDMFVARYTGNGTLMWARRAGGGDFTEGNGVATLPDGSCVVTGFLRGLAIFGLGDPGQTVLGSLYDTNDMFVAKYDAGGALLWARSGGGSAHDSGREVDVFPDGGVAVSGIFGDIAVFALGLPEETFLISQGDLDAFVARYDANGTLMWVRAAGSPLYDDGWGVCTHADGSMTTCGDFQGTFFFSQGEPWVKVLVSGGAVDAFVARYNADGTL